jgi:hypothetical protein
MASMLIVEKDKVKKQKVTTALMRGYMYCLRPSRLSMRERDDGNLLLVSPY